MIEISYRHHGVPIRETWFVEQKTIKFGFLNRVFHAQYMPVNALGVRKKETLVIDLTQWDRSKIHKKTRYDIRRICADHEAPEVRLWKNLTIDEASVIERSYNLFALDKGITKLNRRRLTAIKSNIYYSEFRNRQSTSFHIYLCDDKRVRLLYSWAQICKVNKLGSAALNKSHTAFDIEFFQNLGFYQYDFGGFQKARMNGIDLFKSRFGGESIIEFNFLSLW
ncbi:hypothetical protein N8575_02060 [Gammaproteobacteria bacterium]|nr:hypothetical protein [Gammaproteobacteria bacterium]